MTREKERGQLWCDAVRPTSVFAGQRLAAWSSAARERSARSFGQLQPPAFSSHSELQVPRHSCGAYDDKHLPGSDENQKQKKRNKVLLKND